MFAYEDYCLLRDSKGMKDSDVAKAASIPASTFSDWKKGKSRPKEAKLMKIASALGVTYAYMIGMESEPNQATAALESNIIINDENGGSAEFSKFLHNTTSNFDLTKDEIDLIKKFRQADSSTQDVIIRLLAFASEQEHKNK